MKKLFLVLTMVMFCGTALAGDVLTYQIRYKKLIFKCQNGTEEIVDASATGGNTYERVCVSDGQWTNTFTPFEGIIQLTPDEYEYTDSQELADMKSANVTQFIYNRDNPPVYVEPTAEEYEAMIDEKMKEVEELSAKLKGKAPERIDDVGTEIEETGKKIKE